MLLTTNYGDPEALRHLTYGLHPVIGWLRSQNIDYLPFLKAAGISQESLTEPDSTISPSQELTFLTEVIDFVKMSGFGIDMARQYPLSSYGLLGLAASTSENLLSCFEIFTENIVMTFSYLNFTFTTDQELVHITIEPITELSDTYIYMVDRDIAAIHGIAAEVLGRNLPLLHLELKHDVSGYLDKYRSTHQCPITHSSGHCRMTLEKRWLDEPLLNSQAETSRIFLKQCHQITNSLTSKRTFAEYIRSVIIDSNFESQTLGSIAGKLNTTPRTIQRKLSAEGESFQQLLDEVRSNLACEYLQSTDQSIEKIAFSIGFNDAAALSNAFKRWKGIYPSEYRRKKHSG